MKDKFLIALSSTILLYKLYSTNYSNSYQSYVNDTLILL